MIWQLNNNRIEIWDENTKAFVDFCEGIAVESVHTDLLSGTKTLTLGIHDSVSGYFSFPFPRGQVSKGIVPRLAAYGLTLIDDPEIDADIQQIVLESAQAAPHSFLHDRLGFWKIDGDIVFLAHHPIGTKNPIKALSSYIDEEKTKPQGTFDEWRNLILADVVGNPNMELALSLGALAPIAHLLLEKKVLSLVPLIALIGASSAGKTTCMKLMASIYGSPEESRGLLSDLNATQNAFFAQLGSVFGLPALLDECSSVPEWDFTKVVYNLPKGRDKLRCNSEGKVRESIRFSGAIIMSGERSLFKQTKNTQGLYARLVEFSPSSWTNDAAHANRIEYGCRNNYGTAVVPLITWLLSHQDKLTDVYYKHYTDLCSLITNASGIEDRLLKIYATILTSADVIVNALDISLHIDDIKALLLAHHEQTTKQLLSPEMIFEKIKLKILEHYEKFPEKELAKFGKSLLGERTFHDGKSAIWITEKALEEFLYDIGIDDFKPLKKLFFEKGWLYRTEDRHYVIMHSIGTTRVKCYCLFWDPNTVVAKKHAIRKKTTYFPTKIEELTVDDCD